MRGLAWTAIVAALYSAVALIFLVWSLVTADAWLSLARAGVFALCALVFATLSLRE